VMYKSQEPAEKSLVEAAKGGHSTALAHFAGDTASNSFGCASHNQKPRRLGGCGSRRTAQSICSPRGL